MMMKAIRQISSTGEDKQPAKSHHCTDADSIVPNAGPSWVGESEEPRSAGLVLLQSVLKIENLQRDYLDARSASSSASNCDLRVS